MAGPLIFARIHSRSFRLLALLLVLALGLGLGLGGSNGAGPVLVIAGQATVHTPRQAHGTAAGRPHAVAASATEVKISSGRRHARNVRLPKGVLGPDVVNFRPRSSATSGLRVPSQPTPPRRVLPPHHPPKITGFDARTSRLLPPAAGGRFSDVWANADGTRTTRAYEHPVNYQRPDGSWAPIDTTLVRAGAEWQVRADNVTAQFATAGAASGLAALGFGPGRAISFGVAGAAAVPAMVSADTVAYRGVRPSADLVLEALAGGGAKEQITLHSAAAPSAWLFPLTLRGVTPHLDARGNVVFADASGQPVAVIPHGSMTDSAIGERSGIGAYSAGVTYALVRTGGGWALRMTLDSRWLDDPARVFPVTVDPTAVWNYNDDADTFVQTGYSTSNYTSTELRAGTYDGGSNIAATYLSFSSLSSDLAHDTIYGATLFMDNIWSYSCTARRTRQHRAGSPDTWLADK